MIYERGLTSKLGAEGWLVMGRLVHVISGRSVLLGARTKDDYNTERVSVDHYEDLPIVAI